MQKIEKKANFCLLYTLVPPQIAMISPAYAHVA
jgi:hypothetical protein